MSHNSYMRQSKRLWLLPYIYMATPVSSSISLHDAQTKWWTYGEEVNCLINSLLCPLYNILTVFVLPLFSFPFYTLALSRFFQAAGVRLYTTTAMVWQLFSRLHNDGQNAPVTVEVPTTNELCTAYVELFMITALSWLTLLERSILHYNRQNPVNDIITLRHTHRGTGQVIMANWEFGKTFHHKQRSHIRWPRLCIN
jgi:hypothetical protein